MHDCGSHPDPVGNTCQGGVDGAVEDASPWRRTEPPVACGAPPFTVWSRRLLERGEPCGPPAPLRWHRPPQTGLMGRTDVNATGPMKNGQSGLGAFLLKDTEGTPKRNGNSGVMSRMPHAGKIGRKTVSAGRTTSEG